MMALAGTARRWRNVGGCRAGTPCLGLAEAWGRGVRLPSSLEQRRAQARSAGAGAGSGADGT